MAATQVNTTFRRLALLVILLIAAFFRFQGNAWDAYQGLHPDERFLVMVNSAIDLPHSVFTYFDEGQSPLNPRNRGYAFFAYGTLPETMLKAAVLTLHRTTFSQMTATGRELSALFDLGCVLWIYLIAQRLYGRARISLVAALLYASAVLPIQQAHFYVVDPFLNFFLCGASYFLVRYQTTRSAADSLLTAVMLGLALACKITAIFLCPVVAAVFFIDAKSGWRQRLIRLALCMAVAALVFRVTDPYAFAGTAGFGWKPAARWLANLAESGRLASGQNDVPPGLQWAGRTPLLFPWINMIVWGLGIAAGLAAWIGFAVAAWEMVRRRRWVHLWAVAWIALLFAYQGTRFTFTMRYFLPIYGALVILAAWWLDRWLESSISVVSRRVAIAAAVVVCATSLVWAIAFSAIYRAPHSRIAASEWIYKSIGKGRALGNETWDDPLPVRMYGLDTFGDVYVGVDLAWYDEDKPEKLTRAAAWLDRADYLILSSNRVYGSIVRLPVRYPMTTRYYQALFDGSLGFAPAAEFTSFPRLGALQLADASAEEAFTVYDHPVVKVFRKTERYSHENTVALLNRVRWDDAVQAPAREILKSPTGLLLPDARWREQQSANTWANLFPVGDVGRSFPALAFITVLYLLSLAVLPMLFWCCTGLEDRGYGLSKAAGLLLGSWIAWFGAAAGLWHWNRMVMCAVVLVLLVAGAAAASVQRIALRRFLHRRWGLLAAVECAFLVAFGLMAFLRRSNPDLFHPFFGGEKFMDMTYLTAAIRTDSFPLYNPWFAGGLVNYYYFGFTMLAFACKAAGVVPEVGYNVALCALYAMSACGIFSLAYSILHRMNARHRYLGASTAVASVLMIGNVRQVSLYTDAMARLYAQADFDQLSRFAYWKAVVKGLAISAKRDWEPGVGGWTWYFDATRVFNYNKGEPVPITEFPLFSFSFGDLHAHVIALPFLLLVIGLCTALVLRTDSGKGTRWGLLVAASLAFGALQTTNGWDVPIALLLIIGALLLTARSDEYREVALAAGAVVSVLVISRLLYWPFHYWYAPGYGAFERWRGAQTLLIPFLQVHGLFLLVLLPAAAYAARVRSTWLIGGTFAVAIATVLRQGVTALVVFSASLFLRAAYRYGRENNQAQAWTLLFAACALGIALVPEWLVLKGDIGRMNTVFKFNFEAWTLLAIAAAVQLPVTLRALAGQSSLLRRGWMVTAGLVLAACLAYPATAPFFRVRDRQDTSLPSSWDGMAALPAATFSVCNQPLKLQPDLPMIYWLRDHLSGTPVIAEYNTQPVLYGWGSRFSVFTGLPTIAGWDWHMRQQMGWFESGRVQKRIDDIKQIYGSTDAPGTWQLLKKYDVKYVMFGVLEEACVPDSRGKFAVGEGLYWDPVYQSGKSLIYAVRETPAVMQTRLGE